MPATSEEFEACLPDLLQEFDIQTGGNTDKQFHWKALKCTPQDHTEQQIDQKNLKYRRHIRETQCTSIGQQHQSEGHKSIHRTTQDNKTHQRILSCKHMTTQNNRLIREPCTQDDTRITGQSENPTVQTQDKTGLQITLTISKCKNMTTQKQQIMKKSSKCNHKETQNSISFKVNATHKQKGTQANRSIRRH